MLATSFDFYSKDVREFQDLNFLPVYALVDLHNLTPFNLDSIKGKVKLIFEAKFYHLANNIHPTVSNELLSKCVIKKIMIMTLDFSNPSKSHIIFGLATLCALKI